MRFGIGIIVLLITLIGGRNIPSFTRNWQLARPPSTRIAAGPLSDVSTSSALAQARWPQRAGSPVQMRG
jgi:uncharacterized protein involved in response to NO